MNHQKHIDPMRIEINPPYEYLRGFLEQVPARFETMGTVIHCGRNLIKTVTEQGVHLNIKRYAVPSWVNRVAYTFFRLPKGKRAFDYPQRLLGLGFETPEPVAYIEERREGLIAYSYFVSIQSPYPYTFCCFGNANVAACGDVVKAFAQFTARLHDAGILHLDYSPGNILFDRLPDGYHFSLVDINRMYFGQVGMRRGCANFARLWGQTPFFVLLAEEYAKARNMDPEKCVRLVLAYRKWFWSRYRRRHQVWFELDI